MSCIKYVGVLPISMHTISIYSILLTLIYQSSGSYSFLLSIFAPFNIFAESQHRQHGGLMEGPWVQRGQRGRKRHEHCEYRLGILARRGYVHVCQGHATDDQVMAEGTQDEPLHHLIMA